MISTPGETEKFKGSEPSTSPTAIEQGVFSLCSGGVPTQGSFGRIPGKTIRDAGTSTGGAISIYQFGQKVVVQRYNDIEIFDLTELAPNPADYVVDNEGNQVVNNEGLFVTT